MKRKPRPPAPDPRAPWQIEQAKRCPCHGTDDLCECQNVNWAERDTERNRRAAQKDDLTQQALEAVATGGREQVDPTLLLDFLGYDTVGHS